MMAIYCALALLATVSPIAASPLSLPLRGRTTTSPSLPPFSVPSSDAGAVARAEGVLAKQLVFTYAPGIGGGSFSPGGPLGLEYIASDSAITNVELAQQTLIISNDTVSSVLHAAQLDGLQTVDDYVNLYNGEWQPTSAPTGPDPGMLTNYTQDLLFSMQLLSFSPFSLSRLQPSGNTTLPFTIEDATVQNITGQTLQQLYKAGRLFYVDYSNQQKYPQSPQYYASPDAYFYIAKGSGDFLPLAIRTNQGASLVYTPLDSPDDWLLAKIMFNNNDFSFHAWHHLASTHYVVDIVYESAVRTLSDDHPVLAILKRLMYGALGIRPLATLTLFETGGTCDSLLGLSGSGCEQFTDDLYSSGYAGAFQSNYFLNNLEKRGLLNATTGPNLKHFPYYNDALPLWQTINNFMTSLVGEYYSSDSAVAGDPEIQAWVAEANGPAQVIDFPSSITSRGALTDVMTHMAHLVSTAHHTVNLNQLVTSSGVLPFHPWALYKPIPTTKGVTNVAEYLPPLPKAISLIASAGVFARPLLAGTNLTLTNMFNDPDMLARMTPGVAKANDAFMKTMLARSNVVSKRSFNAQGLSQGMPFVWKALDPEVIPWSITI